MPSFTIPGTDQPYFLIVFDEQGVERPEAGGRLLSQHVARRIADPTDRITDVFFSSHGWKGDIPAAKNQFDRWTAAMAGCAADVAAVESLVPDFRPIVVGLHWPSLPWGDEDVTAGGGLLDVDASHAQDASLFSPRQLDVFASSIANTMRARAAIEVVLEAARNGVPAGPLPQSLRDAYQIVFEESGLPSSNAGGAPCSDHPVFDAQGIVDATTGDPSTAAMNDAFSGTLGFVSDLKDAVLSPLRQLSFWKMKERAQRVGETGGRQLLQSLQRAGPDARFHLMGHSFGCIVVSAMVAGPPGNGSASHADPVDSLFLVQGALSLWSFAAAMPFDAATAGYFRRIVDQRLVTGPILTTRSKFDRAVGWFYPLGAKAMDQYVLAGEELPRFGGIGSFGIRGDARAESLAMASVDARYTFEPGSIYNLEASAVISHGGGMSGAHSDIAHPEVAHAFWSAVEAAIVSSLHGHVFADDVGIATVMGFVPPASVTLQSDEEDLQKGEGERRLKSAPLPYAPPRTYGGGDSTVSHGPFDIDRYPDFKEIASADSAGSFDPGESSFGYAAPIQRDTVEPVHVAPLPTFSPFELPEGGLLSVDNPETAIPSPVPPEDRYLNANILGQAEGDPLLQGGEYALAIGVDVMPQVALSPRFNDNGLFKDDQTEVRLTVQLNSDDFDINKAVGTFVLPRRGKSQTRATFLITPRQSGPSRISATIHKDGNLIQQIELTWDVGSSMRMKSISTGIPVSAAATLYPRTVGLLFTSSGDGYDCTAWGATSARARIEVSPAELAAAVDAARASIMQVVSHVGTNRKTYVFQEAPSIGIDAADEAFALRTLAEAGARLFQRLFFGPRSNADSQGIGRFLRSVITGDEVKLQVIADGAPLPWNILYLADAGEDSILDWNNFLGQRAIIEQKPLQNSLAVTDPIIAGHPQLTISLNFNDRIDLPNFTPVGQQQKFWSALPALGGPIRLTQRSRLADVRKSIVDADTTDQILYFFCHAKASSPDSPGGLDAACLQFGDGSLTLGKLNLDAPLDRPFKNAPLIVLNACESAELSPVFYDGFVPYFMAKGARGVVGTECKTPALFGSDWAERFFCEVISGKSIGTITLALRREYLAKYRNPMAMLYAVHCDVDTRVVPALPHTFDRT